MSTKLTRIQIHISEDMKQKAEETAERLYGPMKLSTLIRVAIERFIKEYETDKKEA